MRRNDPDSPPVAARSPTPTPRTHGPAPAARRHAPLLFGLGRATRAVAWLWLFAVGVAVWWLLSAHSRSLYFPPLTKILRRLYALWIVGSARGQLAASLEQFAVGYAIAGLAGVGGGALLWNARAVREATSPYLYFLYVLPAPVLVPAVVTIFGIGFTMKVVIIAFAAVWPTLLNTLDGMRGVDEIKLDTAQVLGMSPVRAARSVVLRAAAPQIVAGLRGSLQVAIILMVVSEWVASTAGIGYFIVNAQQAFDYLDMWTGIIVLALIGIALNLLFVLVENMLLHWHYASRGTEARP